MDSSNTTSKSMSPAPMPSTSETSDSEGLPPLHLDVKYVDLRYQEEHATYEYSDAPHTEIAAEFVQPIGNEATDDGGDAWNEHCFVVVRKHSMPHEKPKRIGFEIIVKSPYLVQACKEVMGTIRGISWNSEPLIIQPQLLVAYVPRLEEYEKQLSTRTRSEKEDRVLASLRILLAYLRKNYRQTLARIANLVAHGEITFDLLYAILLPGTILLRRCPTTRETRAYRLLFSVKDVNSCGKQFYSLAIEHLEVATNEDDARNNDTIAWEDEDGSVAGNEINKGRFGMLETSTAVHWFEGVAKISSLAVFPLAYHPRPEALTAMLVERGRRWAALSGVHHMHYNGMAGRNELVGQNMRMTRYSVNSRVMIDKTSFARVDADYCLPTPNSMRNASGVDDLSDKDLLLATPIVYGFSLSDKLWLEYNVNTVSPIVWNDEAFAGLVLPSARKTLLRSLVEAHGTHNARVAGGFDDFVRGKGQGLVINLSGPPGVGKTLSAEATSEHLRRPLYVLGSGDLGTDAHKLDVALREAFDLAAGWNAVLLIDEADVFLEQRSLHDLARNAMVAVFLRHIEYSRGILFLTTNRLKAFDAAFLSRIHVALHFDELSAQTRAHVWRAFLHKAAAAAGELSEARLAALAARNINGRQIKNACRTATSLALSRGEAVRYEHLVEALDAMEDFVAEVVAMQEQA